MRTKSDQIKLIILLVVVIAFLVGLLVVIDWLRDHTRGALVAPEETRTQEAVQTTAPIEENPYTSVDFGYDENGYLTCLTGESRLGIDVSYAQKDIDWQQVKEAGVEFVIIRVAGRGWGESGRLYFDDYWRQNYRGAKLAGLDVGVYFFSQAITVEEAKEEAQFLLDQLDGQPLDMPVVYDWEWMDPQEIGDVPRTIEIRRDKQALTDITIAFCEEIKAAGYSPMIYFNADQSHDLVYLDKLTQYPFWLASYTTKLDYPYKVDMWQYTRKGSVPGIEGNVDINLYLEY